MDNRQPVGNAVEQETTDVCSHRLLASFQAWPEVADVMTKEVITIAPEETLVSSARVMSENGVSCLVVKDHGNMTGILTERDLLRTVARGHRDFCTKTAADIMSSPVESISPHLSVLDAGAVMEAKHIKRLPVMSEGRLEGIVTQTDLTRVLASYGQWKDLSEIMSRDVAVVQTNTTAAEAAEVMNSRNVSCIVILEGSRLRGIITEKDFSRRVIVPQRDPRSLRVQDVMSSPVTTIPSCCSVFGARKVMDRMHIRRLVVMDDDRLCGIVTQTDIFKALNEKSREKELDILHLLQSSQNGVYALDSDGKVTYVNPALARLLGVSDPAELVGQPFPPERFRVAPEESCSCLREPGKPDVKIQQLVLKTAEGRKIHVYLSSTFARNIYGEIDGAQGVLHDVSERVRAEETIKHAYEELEAAHTKLATMQSQFVQNEKMASIGQLAAGVAHEMNTPLGFVASNFETLEGYSKKIRDLLSLYDRLACHVMPLEHPRLRSLLDEIDRFRSDKHIDFILEDIAGLFDESREGLERVTTIVRNLRDFSRVDQPGSRDEYDLNKGIEATLVVARNEIKYDADIKMELSEVPLIFCHGGQINQVLLNILVNAAQAIRSQKRENKGTIVVKTRACEQGVVCEIADDGPGIAPEHLSKIFEPFFTTKPPGKGTGLGLSVSYDIIVHKHNGRLLVDSEVGRGTTFTIELPIGTREDDEQETTSDGKENCVVCGR